MGEERYLCMITLYAHALILPMFRVIGSCIMTYIILLCHCFQFIACFFFKFCFVLVVFLLILLYMFCFWVCWKIQKPIKIEKCLKSLITCVVYITCEFGLVPLYLCRNAFMSLACYVCTSIFVGKILKSMCDCCKSIFKLVMNDWSIVLLVLIHA